MDRFLKEPVPALGLSAPFLRRYAAELHSRTKGWPAAARDQLCTDLFACGLHEGGILVAYLYRRRARACGAAELRLFEQWIERYAMSWAHVDGVGTWLIAACVANEPSLAPRLIGWTRVKSQWKRRAAAVSLIYEAKHGRQWEVIREVAFRLREDREDLVQKGVGWLLKVAYGKRPQEVVALLREREFSRLVIRYAAEKMSLQDRQRVGAPAGTRRK